MTDDVGPSCSREVPYIKMATCNDAVVVTCIAYLVLLLILLKGLYDFSQLQQRTRPMCLSLHITTNISWES